MLVFEKSQKQHNRSFHMVTKQRRRYKSDHFVKGSFQNILAYMTMADTETIEEGKQWYSNAHIIGEQVSALLGYDDPKYGIGIVSALSPQMEWGDNIEQAILFASTGWSNNQTADNNNKAIDIANGADPLSVLGGEKVTAFYQAILTPHADTKPVVDRHAMAVYCNYVPEYAKLSQAMGNARVMRRIQSAYTKAHSYYPELDRHAVQAITWILQRKMKEVTRRVGQ